MEQVWCSIFGKLKISTILLNTIPAGNPVGGCEPLQAQGEATAEWNPVSSLLKTRDINL